MYQCQNWALMIAVNEMVLIIAVLGLFYNPGSNQFQNKYGNLQILPIRWNWQYRVPSLVVEIYLDSHLYRCTCKQEQTSFWQHQVPQCISSNRPTSRSNGSAWWCTDCYGTSSHGMWCSDGVAFRHIMSARMLWYTPRVWIINLYKQNTQSCINDQKKCDILLSPEKKIVPYARWYHTWGGGLWNGDPEILVKVSCSSTFCCTSGFNLPYFILQYLYSKSLGGIRNFVLLLASLEWQWTRWARVPCISV